jgi:hypothetical protein
MAAGDVIRLGEDGHQEIGRVQAADVDGLTTPTLAEVLAAGNVVSGFIITESGGSFAIAADGDVAGVVVQATNGGQTSIAADAQVSISTQRLTIQTDNSSGTIGQVLTAQGDSTAIWDDLALQPAADFPPGAINALVAEANVADTAGLGGTYAALVYLLMQMRASGLMAQVPASLEFGQQPTNAVVYVAPQNEIQRITGGGVISGGTWDITSLFGVSGGGFNPLNIPWDIDAAGLSGLLPYDAVAGDSYSVVGGPLASAPFDIEVLYSASPFPESTVDAANLTGTDPTLTPSTVQEGIAEAGIISPPVTVRVSDDLGTLCTRETAPVTVALMTPGGATLVGTATKVPVAGIATFDDLAVDTAGSYQIAAVWGVDGIDIGSVAFTIS